MSIDFEQQGPAKPNYQAMNRSTFPVNSAASANEPAPAAPRVQEGTLEPGGGVKKSIFDVVADIVHAPGDALQAGKKVQSPTAKMAQTPATAPEFG